MVKIAFGSMPALDLEIFNSLDNRFWGLFIQIHLKFLLLDAYANKKVFFLRLVLAFDT